MSTPSAGSVFNRSRKRHETPVKHWRVELRPVGADGSAVATAWLRTGAARITHIAVDYQNQPATTDLLIYDTLGGTAYFGNSNSATDIPVRGVATPGALDEGSAVTAATDGVDGGWFVKDGLYFDVAQGDGQTSGDEVIIVDVWGIETDIIEVKLFPTGADGSAVATRLVKMHRAGIIQGIQCVYGAGVTATTDLVIKADVLDDLSGGNTLFTRSNSATSHLIGVGLGIIGIDEGNAAVAATDAIGGGQPFKRNLYFDIAQADAYSTNEDITVRLWAL